MECQVLYEEQKFQPVSFKVTIQCQYDMDYWIDLLNLRPKGVLVPSSAVNSLRKDLMEIKCRG